MLITVSISSGDIFMVIVSICKVTKNETNVEVHITLEQKINRNILQVQSAVLPRLCGVKQSPRGAQPLFYS